MSWPNTRPQTPWLAPHGWLKNDTCTMLAKYLPRDGLVIELGSWLGMSARWILDQRPDCWLVCVDTWEGDICSGASAPDELRQLMIDGRLFEVFAQHCWNYRDRIEPLQMTTTQGIAACVKELRVQPGLIYLDASHDAASVAGDLRGIRDAFPCVPIVGDDWNMSSVQAGVRAVIEPTETNEDAWAFRPER